MKDSNKKEEEEEEEGVYCITFNGFVDAFDSVRI